MMNFLSEILPYCILGQMAWTYGHSWKVDIRHTSDGSQSTRLPAESHEFDVNLLPGPNPESLLSQLGFDWRPSILGRSVICLPPGTILTIDYEPQWHSSVSTVVLKLPGCFEIRIQVRPAVWFAGLPNIEKPAYPQSEFNNQNFGTVTLDVSFHAAFESPNLENNDLFEHVNWAEQLSNELRIEWDWDTNTGPQSDHTLRSIQRDIQKLIDRN